VSLARGRTRHGREPRVADHRRSTTRANTADRPPGTPPPAAPSPLRTMFVPSTDATTQRTPRARPFYRRDCQRHDATGRRQRRRPGFGARRCRAGIISNGPRDRDLISRFWRAFPRERRPVGGNRAPACQKRLGEIWRRRGNGAVFRENCRYSASEATIAGREPRKDRFGNYSDPQPEICFGRDALCTICWRDGACDPIGPDPSLPGTATYSSLRRAPAVADQQRVRTGLAAGGRWIRTIGVWAQEVLPFPPKPLGSIRAGWAGRMRRCLYV